ncbi:MAG: prephenate dehydrogenase [Chloroflexi bacterium]|nr:prephenate dehydrogenase [Chloroflexota bacterium]
MDDPAFALRDATIAIVGIGLMGGSLALALRAQNACRAILGITRSPATRDQALARGAVDEASGHLSLAASADVIVLATPVRTIMRQMAEIGAVARAGAVIMDLGSTKQAIVRAMEQLPARLEPIGAHPMCGKETFGFHAADAALFQNAPFVLTPLARTSPATLALAQTLALTVGARPIVLDPARHDRIVGAISHLPFALAATLMATAADLAQNDDLLFTLAAGGFRDTSRLAASDTTMMLDILLTNSNHVANLMRTYAARLNQFADSIEGKDESALRTMLEHAARSRRELYV